MFCIQTIIILLCFFLINLFKKYIFSKRNFANTTSKITLFCNGSIYETQQAIKTALYVRENFLLDAEILIVLTKEIKEDVVYKLCDENKINLNINY